MSLGCRNVIGSDFCCFTLRTGEGASLARPLLLVPNADRHLGWLVCPDGAAFDIAGDETAGIAIAVRLEHGVPAGPVRLQHALRRRFMLGHYADPKNGTRSLAFRHLAQDGRQDFWLDPASDWQPSAQIAAIAGELCGAVGVPPCFADMLEALRGARLRGALADAALRCLPPDELENLARHLLENPADLALLQTSMPGNLWFERRLPRLIAWRRARSQERPRPLIPSREPSADLAGGAGTTVHPMTLGLVLNGYARAAMPPRRMACVLATARNEGPYLLEWIAYHRAVGFEHVFLYSNDTTDGSDDMLQLLCDAGVISWFHNQIRPETLPQHRAYGHALAVMPEILDYRWTMIADIDEYVGFDKNVFESIPDYLAWQEQRRADAVALPWKTYIAAPRDVWHDAPSIARFTLRDAAISPFVKMIFRTNQVWSANSHYPEPVFASSLAHRSESGEAHVQRTTPAQSARPSARYGWMSHYAFRSAPEMIMKLARGRADHPASSQGKSGENRIRHFLAQLNAADKIQDRSMLTCGAQQAEERARLLSIPGLAACEADVKRGYATRMRQRCSDFLDETAGAAQPDDIKALRAVLQGALAADNPVKLSMAWRSG